MLRGVFALGVVVIFCVWILALAVMQFGFWAGVDLAQYASTILILAALIWIALMFAIIARRVGRYFAKLS